MFCFLLIFLLITTSFRVDASAFDQPPSQPFGVHPDETNEETEEAQEFSDEEYLTEEESLEIADPLYPFNKAMYHFNDKLYFWFLRPAAQGYSKVIPEDVRVSVSNFFSNITVPVRIAGCMLQGKFMDAGNETIRFVYNSTAGVFGLMDAAATDLGIRQQDEDIGQALGTYGIDHGFYIVWPFLGPSSARDTAGRVGDAFLNPVSYISPWEAKAAVSVYERTNAVSLRLGDYEDLKEAAIDPYVSIRDGYLQRRKAQVEK